MTGTVVPRFDHLCQLTDDRGTFEHALFTEARREHGYCTDDMARVLVVATREPHATSRVLELARTSIRFLADAQSSDGRYRNRMNQRGRWEDRPALEDCWGRSIWGLGTTVSHTNDIWLRVSAMVQFERAVKQRSEYPRAMAFAAIGAAELLATEPRHRGALSLLTDAADSMALPRSDTRWPWPEARLRYANAVVPEAMIAAGSVLQRPSLLRHGLQLLSWLLDYETSKDGHLSVTPVGGAGPGDARPAFDQQPIEVAALADACARAASVDGDRRWLDGINAAQAWFLGANDGQHVMWDKKTGGGFDGLTPGGANLNEGAESTLALLATLQHARRLVTVAR